MKSSIKLAMAGLLLFSANNNAHAQFGDLLNKAKKVVSSGTGTNTGGSYTNAEAVSALKEALKIGTQNSANKVSALNGYFGNQLIKILMLNSIIAMDHFTL